jgi:SAM-dependent methyltransferase
MELFSFGPWLAKCRCAFLGELGRSRHALILGDGDGRFTAQLLRSNRTVEVDAVDLSPAMLRALVRRAGLHASRVRSHHADIRNWRPGKPSEIDHFLPQNRQKNAVFDLVITHFFLDCLTTSEAQTLAESLHPHLAPDAIWLISEFAIPHGIFGRLVARPLISALYLAFGWLTGLAVRRLPDHHTALNAAGFRLSQTQTHLHGLLVSELWRPNID